VGFVARLVLGCVLLGAAIGASDAEAQQIPARLDAYATADSVAVGERFTLVVTAEHGFAVNIRFPENDAGPMIFGDVQVVAPRETGERYLGAEAPGTRIDSARYTVTTFALDTARVPTLPVQVITAAGDTLTGGTPTVEVPVYATVASDDTRLRGLAPLATFPEPRWPWILLGVALVCLIGVLLYLWRTRREEEPPPAVPEEPQPDTTAHEQILAELQALEAVDLSDPDNAKPFYVRLSNSLRRYLGARLDMSTMERTTREVVAHLERRTDVPPVVTSRVRAVLELADLVKFSGARTSADDGDMALRETRNVVEVVESRHVETVSSTRAAAPSSGSERDGRNATPPETVDHDLSD
jgi:hypothetical protein